MSRGVILGMIDLHPEGAADAPSLSILGADPAMWIAERLGQAPSLDLLCVAAPAAAGAARAAALARRLGTQLLARASGAGLRERCLEAARAAGASVIVHAGVDAPLVDPGLVEEMARAAAGGVAGALASAINLTPGLGVRVFTTDWLEGGPGSPISRLAGDAALEEWPVPRVLARPDLRLLLETEADQSVLEHLFEELGEGRAPRSEQAVEYLAAHPGIASLNRLARVAVARAA